MMTVVKIANLNSEIESLRGAIGGAEVVSNGTVREGELLRELDWRAGRHFNTASTEARHGWTCSG